jgi:hypothetical protein
VLHDPPEHVVHVLVVAPVAELAVPAPHCVHADRPAVDANVPVPHAWQVDDDEAPVAALYLPVLHCVHVPLEVAAVVVLQVPTPHEVH